jgi:hypothetical protein
MTKAKTNYHALFKKSPAVKIAAVVIFAMFINILNLGAFASLRDCVRPSSSLLQLENELGRICSVVNFPIKIINDMFKKDREISGDNENKNKNANNKLFALLVPLKETKKSGSILQLDAIVPLNGGKTIFKSGIAVLTGMPSKYCSMFNYLAGIDIVRCMLLMLIIMLLLPRGIPVKIKNFINKILHFPSLFQIKTGFSFLLRNAKGD